jgi:dephospho-CoA kinase
MGFHLFGLTGGLASGKSTVAVHFRQHGVPVIDADQLAREVTNPGTAGLAEIAQVFGSSYLAEDGTLDRKKLAAIVFADPTQRRRLNAILHPRIGALTAQRGTELEASGVELACYEAALLVENGLADAFRPLVVVAVPEAVQVSRAMAREGWTEEEAKARIRAQLPLSAKVAAADFVIDNAGAREATLRQADDVLGRVRARFGLDAGR